MSVKFRTLLPLFAALLLGFGAAIAVPGWLQLQVNAQALTASLQVSFEPLVQTNPVDARASQTAPQIPLAPATHRINAAPNPMPVLRADYSPVLHPVSPATAAAIYIVTNTNDTGAGSLRAAVDQANANPGHDLVQFNLPSCPCTIAVFSQIVISDDLTITGPGENDLSISGFGTNRIFIASTNSLHLEYLTLENGLAPGSVGGGAVYAAELTLNHVVVRDSVAPSGGGVQVIGSAVMTETTFISNTATTGQGGGVSVGGNLTGNNLVFYDNRAYTDGGGAYVSGNVNLQDGLFTLNQTTQVKSYGGGGGLISFGISTLTNTQFLTNTTPAWGGGAYLANFSAGTVNHSSGVIFQGNQAVYGGGGLFQWFAAELTDTDFIDNQSTTYGGGVYAGYAGNYQISISGGLIQGNTAQMGGGLYSDSSISVNQAEIINNTASDGRGGGAYVLLAAAITDTVFIQNTAHGATGNGGGLAVGASQGNGSTDLLRVTFTENSSPNAFGGGLFSYGATRLVDSIFTGNTSYNDGGGAWTGGPLTLRGGLFQGNRTTLIEGSGGGGGLMSMHQATITATQFISNTSADWGGGVYLYNPSNPVGNQVTQSTFSDNRANNGGGGGMFSWFASTLTDTIFTENYASWRGGGVYGSYAGNYPLTLHGGIFTDNSGIYGGGLFSDGDINLDGVTFISNTARSGNGGGAGTAQSARVANSTFNYNQVLANGNGGGLDAAVNAWLTDTVFIANQTLTGSGGGSGTGGNITALRGEYRQNQAFDDGGGLLAYGFATLHHTEFYTNTTGDLGGGLAATNLATDQAYFQGNLANNGGGAFVQASFSLQGDTFSANSAVGSGGGLLQSTTASPVSVVSAVFSGNQAGGFNGGGLYSDAAALSIQSTQFTNNTAGNAGGGLYAAQADLTGVLFEHNSAGSQGGGLALSAGANTLSQVRFLRNQALAGGGLALFGSAGGNLVNSLLAGNTASGGTGQALYLDTTSAVTLQHVTLGAPAQIAGSAIYLSAGDLSLHNTILSNHALGLVRLAGSATLDNPLFFANGADTQGSGITINNPVNGDPVFFSPPTDDYHLGAGSLADNAGFNAGVSSDYDGDFRPQGGGYDIGYDEAVTPSGIEVFSTAPQPGGVPVQFSALLNFGQAVRFTWDFGDGGTAQGQMVTHTYTQPGVYQVTVTAANAAGQNQASIAVTITAYQLFLPTVGR